MKRILTIILAASAMILISFTVNSSANKIQTEEKPEPLFAPRGGYALEDAKI